MERLRDRVILITGSTGIAAAAAERCAVQGAAVFVVSRTAEHARDLAQRLETDERGPGAAWAQADLTEEAAVDAAVAAAVERFGRIDGLFSVAGGSGRRFGDGPIHELTADGWDRTMALNLRSQALVARAVTRVMLAQAPDGRRSARVDRARVQRARGLTRPRAVRDPRLRGRQGRDRVAGHDDGRGLCAGPDPGQRRRTRPDRHTDVQPCRGRPGHRSSSRHASSRSSAVSSRPTTSPTEPSISCPTRPAR
ncbi:MAG: SDR family NAD(P)-dependent oxidoreductase [Candidatus Limnocylindrales bacterium]